MNYRLYRAHHQLREPVSGSGKTCAYIFYESKQATPEAGIKFFDGLLKGDVRTKTYTFGGWEGKFLKIVLAFSRL